MTSSIASSGSGGGPADPGGRESAARRGCCAGVVTDEVRLATFRALADPNRVALLARLAECGRPCTVSEIAGCLDVDLSVVSRHLRQLREAGILRAERRGKAVYYEVRYGEIVRTLRTLADAIEACCPEPVSDRDATEQEGAIDPHRRPDTNRQ